MAASLPILSFHSLDDQSSNISFSPRVFQRGMARLHEKGYQTISLLEALNFLRQGMPFPERSLVITFDDGYQTVYDEAFPILQRYSMSATVFLTVGERGMTKVKGVLPPLEGRSMLSWHNIREMHQWGITFGAHTLTHPDLTQLPLDQAVSEIYDSKSIIEDALGSPVTCFAYPYGGYNDYIRELVRQYFLCACSVKFRLVTARSDLYLLERIDACYFRTDLLFGVILTGWFPSYVWARNIPRSLRRAFQKSERGCHGTCSSWPKDFEKA
jgi:peptidoglycan/xylan/chitin deacetylase (PgdA/CDA1 family)